MSTSMCTCPSFPFPILQRLRNRNRVCNRFFVCADRKGENGNMTIQIEQQMAKLKKSYTEEELESFVRLSDRWLRKNDNATFEAWADAMILQTLSLIDEEEPYWTFVAAQIYLEKLYDQFATRRGVGVEDVYKVFPEQLARYTEAGLYHDCLTTKYSELELVELASYLEQSRDELFTYIGLKTLMDRLCCA
ncbi:Ribonucleoside-diphosphate reductase OS=Lysinibacillus sphaericus OX=1421 GN=nrdE1 PE=3 SV=1 [Lysinibacillus sphaericus]